jgi:hypothetical protein
MPAPAPINPTLVRSLFRYDPNTGELIPTQLAPNAARKTDRYQWEVGAHRYSLHRLVWAYHNPDTPNPYCVQFKDGDKTNTRIENLSVIHTNPRWVNHQKQQPLKITASGKVLPLDASSEEQRGAHADEPTQDAPVKPRRSVLLREAQDARLREEAEAMTRGFEQDVLRESSKNAMQKMVEDWSKEG